MKKQKPIDNLNSMKVKQLVLFFLSIAQFAVLGQVVNVDPYTGSGSVNIPLWTVTTKDLAYPIGLRYSARGMPAAATSGNLGAGWYLQAESHISRQVKGLPDDYLGTSPVARYGWLYANSRQYIDLITPISPSTVGIADTTNTNYAALDSLGGFNTTDAMIDTEPDIFSINVPGLSASFVFDHDGNITFSKPTHMLLEDTSPDGADHIESFKLTTDNGTNYYFEENSQTIVKTLPVVNDTVKYFKHKYFLYKNALSYVANWRLTSIVSPSGDEINFEYKSTSPAPSNIEINQLLTDNYTLHEDTVYVYEYNDLTDSYDKNFQYIIHTTPPPYDYQLKAITTSTQRVEITTKSLVLPTGEYKLKKSLVGGVNIYDDRMDELIKKYQFDYVTFGQDEDDDDQIDGSYSHIFLQSVTEHSDITTFAPYSFEYYGIDLSREISSLDRDTDHIDQYGFHNKIINPTASRKQYIYPELTGADRVRLYPIANYSGQFFALDGKENSSVDLSRISNGSLKKITLPSGGTNTIIYEPNMYFDSLSQTDLYGGGLRVKQTEIHDGVDHARDIITRYSYEDSSSNSTGKLIYRPLFSFQLPFYNHPQSDTITYYHEMLNAGLSSEEIFKRTLIRTDWDITREDNPGISVAYEQTTITANGTGKTVYEFDIPTDYRSLTTAIGGVPQTNMAVAFPESANNKTYEAQLDVNERYGIPGIRHPFDLNNNGNLTKLSLYDESGELVKETINQYKQIGSSTKVFGFKLFKDSTFISYNKAPFYQFFEADTASFLFAHYKLKLGLAQVLESTEQRNYDPTGNDNYISSRVTYEYDSVDHHYLTKKTAYGIEDTSFVYYTYPLDYVVDTTSSTLDDQSLALFYLINKNEVNNPIEVVSTRNINGVEKLVSAALNLPEYNPRLERTLGKATYVINKPMDYSGFSTSVINNVSSDYTFSYDQEAYEKVSSIDAYDDYSNPASITTQEVAKQGVHFGENGQQTKLIISGALANEVLFSNFESIGIHDFHQENTASATGRNNSAGKQLSSGSSNKIYGTVLHDDAEAYLLSCWIKASSSGTLTVDLSDEGSQTASDSTDFSNTSGDWKYYEVQISASNLADSVTIDLYTDTTIDIDDVAFYPINASVNYYLYGKNGVKLVETDTRGTSAYYEYDDLNRIQLIKDDELNIVKQYSYRQYGGNSIWEPNLTWSGNYAGDSITFTATPDIASTATYKWRFVKMTSNFANDEIALKDFSGVTGSASNTTTFVVDTLASSWFVNLQITYDGETKELDYFKRIDIVHEPLEVTMTANRPQLIDICNPEPDPPIGSTQSATANNVHIEVAVANAKGSVAYQWTKVRIGSSDTPTILVDTDEDISNSDYYGQKYRCKITDANLTETVEMSFTTYQSDPGCTPIDPSN